MTILKPRKESIINEIVSYLNAHTTRNLILSSNVDRWQISSRTFDRYFKEAKERHSESQQAIQKELDKDQRTHAKQLLKKALITRDDVLRKLQEIVMNAKRDSDKINACKLICDIKGYKAPVQSEVEIKQTPIFSDNPLIKNLGLS